MFCDHCGKQIPEGATFCRFCGAAIPAPPAVKKPGNEEAVEKAPAGTALTGSPGLPETAGKVRPEPPKTGTPPVREIRAPSGDSPSGKEIFPGFTTSHLIWLLMGVAGTVLLSLWWPSGLSLLSPLVLITGALIVLAGLTKGTIRRVLGGVGAILGLAALGIILMEAFRSSVTYFGDITFYGYEIDTHLLVLSLIGGVMLISLGIRAVRRPSPGALPPDGTGAAGGPGKKVPVFWIAAGIIVIVIIGLVIAVPIMLDTILAGQVPGISGAGSERTPPSTTRMTPTATTTVTPPPATTTSGYITITSTLPPPPAAAFMGSPVSGRVPLPVQFTDRSTGQPAVWQWDFGDGMTSPEKDPVHIYTEPGTYTVTLKAINTGGSTSARKSGYISVLESASLTTPQTTAPPQLISSFQYDTASGQVPLTVRFTDTTQGGPITARYWKFGDGTTSYEQNPVHTYTTAGTYWPELTVTTVNGNAWSMSGPITATSAASTGLPTTIVTSPPSTATGIAPLAQMEYDVDLGPAPLRVIFTDRSTGSPTAWSWDFGDGSTSVAQNPAHTYTGSGSFYVRLTVQNTYGTSMIMQGPIEVFYRL
jgi:PKD repeat protein